MSACCFTVEWSQHPPRFQNILQDVRTSQLESVENHNESQPRYPKFHKRKAESDNKGQVNIQNYLFTYEFQESFKEHVNQPGCVEPHHLLSATEEIFILIIKPSLIANVYISKLVLYKLMLFDIF